MAKQIIKPDKNFFPGNNRPQYDTHKPEQTVTVTQPSVVNNPVTVTKRPTGNDYIGSNAPRITPAKSISAPAGFSGLSGSYTKYTPRQIDVSTPAGAEAYIWKNSSGKARDDWYIGLESQYDTFGSQYYNPYRKATNNAYFDTLRAYGLDVPDVVTDSWLQDTRKMYNGYLTTSPATGAPQTPKKNDVNGQIAYTLYQLSADEISTQKAEQEWAELKDQVTYWTKKGLSDQEIKNKIDMSKFPALRSMDDTYTTGKVNGYNRVIGYSKDAIDGVIWKVRNPGYESTDDFTAAVYSKMYAGKGDQVSWKSISQRTPGSVKYMPNGSGATNDEARRYFGRDEFDWPYIKAAMQTAYATGDNKAKALLKDLSDVQDQTEAAEKEYADLLNKVATFPYDSDITLGTDETLRDYFDKKVGKWLDKSYPTLIKMDDKRLNGSVLPLNKTNTYRREDVVDQMVGMYQAAHGGYLSPKDAINLMNSTPAVPDGVSTTTSDVSDPGFWGSIFHDNRPDEETVKAGQDRATELGYKAPTEPVKVTPQTGIPVSKLAKTVASANNLLNKDSKVDIGNRTPINTAALKDADWEDVGDGYATLYSMTKGIGGKKNQMNVLVTPIRANGSVLTPAELDEYLTKFEDCKTVEEVMQLDTEGLILDAEAANWDDNESLKRLDAKAEQLHDLSDQVEQIKETTTPRELSSDETWDALKKAFMGKTSAMTASEKNAVDAIREKLPGVFNDEFSYSLNAFQLGGYSPDINAAVHLMYDGQLNAGAMADIIMQMASDADIAEQQGLKLAQYYNQDPENAKDLNMMLQNALRYEQASQEAARARNEAEKQQNLELITGVIEKNIKGEKLTPEETAIYNSFSVSDADVIGILEDDQNRDYYLEHYDYPTVSGLVENYVNEAVDKVNELNAQGENYQVDYDAYYIEGDGIADELRRTLAETAKIANAAGMSLGEFLEKYPEYDLTPEQRWAQAKAQYDAKISLDKLTPEQKKDLNFWATTGYGVVAGALDVAEGDIGFAADVVDIALADQRAQKDLYMQRNGNDYVKAAQQYRSELVSMAFAMMADNPERGNQILNAIQQADDNGQEIFSVGISVDHQLIENFNDKTFRGWGQNIDNVVYNRANQGMITWYNSVKPGTSSAIKSARALATMGLVNLPAMVSAGKAGGAAVLKTAADIVKKRAAQSFATSLLSFFGGTFDPEYRNERALGTDKLNAMLRASVIALTDSITEAPMVAHMYNGIAEGWGTFLGNTARNMLKTVGPGITAANLGKRMASAALLYAEHTLAETTQEFFQDTLEGAERYAFRSADEGKPLKYVNLIDFAGQILKPVSQALSDTLNPENLLTVTLSTGWATLLSFGYGTVSSTIAGQTTPIASGKTIQANNAEEQKRDSLRNAVSDLADRLGEQVKNAPNVDAANAAAGQNNSAESILNDVNDALSGANAVISEDTGPQSQGIMGYVRASYNALYEARQAGLSEERQHELFLSLMADMQDAGAQNLNEEVIDTMWEDFRTSESDRAFDKLMDMIIGLNPTDVDTTYANLPGQENAAPAAEQAAPAPAVTAEQAAPAPAPAAEQAAPAPVPTAEQTQAQPQDDPLKVVAESGKVWTIAGFVKDGTNYKVLLQDENGGQQLHPQGKLPTIGITGAQANKVSDALKYFRQNGELPSAQAPTSASIPAPAPASIPAPAQAPAKPATPARPETLTTKAQAILNNAVKNLKALTDATNDAIVKAALIEDLFNASDAALEKSKKGVLTREELVDLVKNVLVMCALSEGRTSIDSSVAVGWDIRLRAAFASGRVDHATVQGIYNDLNIDLLNLYDYYRDVARENTSRAVQYAGQQGLFALIADAYENPETFASMRQALIDKILGTNVGAGQLAATPEAQDVLNAAAEANENSKKAKANVQNAGANLNAAQQNFSSSHQNASSNPQAAVSAAKAVANAKENLAKAEETAEQAQNEADKANESAEKVLNTAYSDAEKQAEEQADNKLANESGTVSDATDNALNSKAEPYTGEKPVPVSTRTEEELSDAGKAIDDAKNRTPEEQEEANEHNEAVRKEFTPPQQEEQKPEEKEPKRRKNDKALGRGLDEAADSENAQKQEGVFNVLESSAPQPENAQNAPQDQSSQAPATEEAEPEKPREVSAKEQNAVTEVEKRIAELEDMLKDRSKYDAKTANKYKEYIYEKSRLYGWDSSRYNDRVKDLTDKLAAPQTEQDREAERAKLQEEIDYINYFAKTVEEAKKKVEDLTHGDERRSERSIKAHVNPYVLIERFAKTLQVLKDRYGDTSFTDDIDGTINALTDYAKSDGGTSFAIDILGSYLNTIAKNIQNRLNAFEPNYKRDTTLDRIRSSIVNELSEIRAGHIHLDLDALSSDKDLLRLLSNYVYWLYDPREDFLSYPLSITLDESNRNLDDRETNPNRSADVVARNEILTELIDHIVNGTEISEERLAEIREKFSDIPQVGKLLSFIDPQEPTAFVDSQTASGPLYAETPKVTLENRDDVYRLAQEAARQYNTTGDYTGVRELFRAIFAWNDQHPDDTIEGYEGDDDILIDDSPYQLISGDNRVIKDVLDSWADGYFYGNYDELINSYRAQVNRKSIISELNKRLGLDPQNGITWNRVKEAAELLDSARLPVNNYTREQYEADILKRSEEDRIRSEERRKAKEAEQAAADKAKAEEAEAKEQARTSRPDITYNSQRTRPIGSAEMSDGRDALKEHSKGTTALKKSGKLDIAWAKRLIRNLHTFIQVSQLGSEGPIWNYGQDEDGLGNIDRQGRWVKESTAYFTAAEAIAKNLGLDLKAMGIDLKALKTDLKNAANAWDSWNENIKTSTAYSSEHTILNPEAEPELRKAFVDAFRTYGENLKALESTLTDAIWGKEEAAPATESAPTVRRSVAPQSFSEESNEDEDYEDEDEDEDEDDYEFTWMSSAELEELGLALQSKPRFLAWLTVQDEQDNVDYGIDHWNKLHPEDQISKEDHIIDEDENDEDEDYDEDEDEEYDEDENDEDDEVRAFGPLNPKEADELNKAIYSKPAFTAWVNKQTDPAKIQFGYETWYKLHPIGQGIRRSVMPQPSSRSVEPEGSIIDEDYENNGAFFMDPEQIPQTQETNEQRENRSVSRVIDLNDKYFASEVNEKLKDLLIKYQNPSQRNDLFGEQFVQDLITDAQEAMDLVNYILNNPQLRNDHAIAARLAAKMLDAINTLKNAMMYTSPENLNLDLTYSGMVYKQAEYADALNRAIAAGDNVAKNQAALKLGALYPRLREASKNPQALEYLKQRLADYNQEQSQKAESASTVSDKRAARGRLPKFGAQNKNGKLESPIQTFNTLTRQLGIGNYNEHKPTPMTKTTLSLNARAYYNLVGDMIVMGNRQSGEQNVGLHEIGHAIEERTGFHATPAMVQALINSSPEAAAFINAYSPVERPFETMAEFTRMWMQSEDQARRIFSDQVVNDFESALKKAKIWDYVHGAAVKARAYAGATMDEKVSARTTNVAHDDRLSIYEQGTWKWLKKAVTGMLNGTYTFGDVRRSFVAGIIADDVAGRDFDRASRSSLGQSKLQSYIKMLKFYERTGIVNITQRMTDDTGKTVDEHGLQQVMNYDNETGELLLKNSEDYALWERLAIYKIAIDRYRAAERAAEKTITGLGLNTINPTQAEQDAIDAIYRESISSKTVLGDEFTIDELENRVAEIERDHPNVARSHEQAMEWWHEFMEVWFPKMGISANTIARLQTMYPNYIPTKRDILDANIDFNLWNVKGSTLDIITPFVTIQDNVVGAIYKAYRNNAAREVYETLLRQNREIDLSDPKNPKPSLDLGEYAVLLPEDTAPGAAAINEGKVIDYKDENGNHHYMEIRDDLLAEVLAESQANAGRMLNTLGKLTRSMAMLTTGLNARFSVKNFMRDFQKSVNYGSWASNYITAVPKWIASAVEVIRDTETHQMYTNLGGGGFTQLENNENARKASEVIRNVLPNYGNDTKAGRVAERVAKFAGGIFTANKLNEVIEQTSRYAEFRFGKHDLSTEEGRVEAFLAAQAATVDFARRGNSEFAAGLRKIIPFWNASIQGAYQNIEMFSEEERDRLAPRLIKHCVNNLITGVLAWSLLHMFGDDDDKEWYEKLSDEIKWDNIVLPFMDNKEHRRQFIRLPLAQDPYAKLFYQVGRALMDYANGGEMTLELAEFAQHILGDNLKSDPMWQPYLDVLMNRNYYGGQQIPDYLLEKNIDEQFVDTTPEIFIQMSRALKAVGIQIAPIHLQYLAEQYSGFVGQNIIPLISPDKLNPGEKGLQWDQLLKSLGNSFTIDPAYTNDINNSYYSGKKMLEQIKGANGVYSSHLSTDLDDAELQLAVNEATQLLGTNGAISYIDTQIKALRDQIAEIPNMPGLSTTQKEIARRNLMRQVIDLEEEGCKYISEYQNRYCGNKNVIQTVFDYHRVQPSASALTKYPIQLIQAAYDGDRGMELMNELYTDSDYTSPTMTSTYYDEDGTKYTLKGMVDDDGNSVMSMYGDEWMKGYQEAWKDWGPDIETAMRRNDTESKEEADDLFRQIFKDANEYAKEWLEDYLGKDLTTSKPRN